ncbi:NRF1 family protein [Megaselia abdita]
MNEITVSTGTGHTTQKIYKIERIEEVINEDDDMDDDDDPPSSPGSMYDEDLQMGDLNDDVVQQLAAAGPVGVAAAAAIASSKKRRRHHSFETNPSIRKRQQNRLLRKLRQIIYEFTGRVGQQAIVLVATPGKPNTSFKVFGAKPLEDVVRNLKSVVMEELETALANQAPPPQQEDPTLFELPPLIIDGIPTPVEKMTQAQLRAFIPLMLKYSTGRGKPGWGRESTRPPWWPKELPWANVRMDARTEEDKQKISWTHALRKIVVNCYKYHGREDLLPTFSDDEDKNSIMITNSVGSPGSHNGQAQIHIQTTSHSTSSSQTSVVTTTAAAVEAARQQANNNSNVGSVLKLHNSGTIITQSNLNHQSNIIQTSNGTTKIELHTSNGTTTIQPQSQHHHHNNQQHQSIQTSNSTAAQTIANAQVCLDPMTLSDVDYSQAVISTIQNADGTVSLFQMDPNNPIITLPDGTTAQVQGVATLHQGEGGATIQTVQSLTDANGHENMTVDLTEATLNQDGQIIITGEDGQGYPVSVGNMITLPVSASMYQTMMANIQQIQPNGDGTVCITPMQIENGDQMETITVSPSMHQMLMQGSHGNEPQVLQVFQLDWPGKETDG